MIKKTAPRKREREGERVSEVSGAHARDLLMERIKYRTSGKSLGK